MSALDTPLRNVVSLKQDLVVVDPRTTLAKALLLMQQFGVLSLPILNDKYDSKDPESTRFSSVIDITDILMYVSFGNFDETSPQETTSEQLSGEKLSFLTVSDVVGSALKLQTGMFYSGLYVMKSTDKLKDALEMSRGGVQRIIVDLGNDRYKLVSQMDLLKYLATCDEQWVEDLMRRRVDSMSSLQRSDEFNELCTMTEKESALAGFRRMLRNKADAVAILSENGKLVGTLSPSDLKFLFERTGSLKDVLHPVKDFLKDIHQHHRKQLKVRDSDDVESAVFKCVLGKVHRVWMTDEDFKPKACLRVQDLIEELHEASRAG